MDYLPELISVAVIAIFMSISPGADFAMITRNSLLHGRKTGLLSSVGISLAIWVHVTYSIAGLAFVIANSVWLFSLIKYLGAAYLIYIGWQTFRVGSSFAADSTENQSRLSAIQAVRMGFITNALNPKTTLFFLSIFTQVVDPETPVSIQIIYGAIISFAHLIWFSCVSLFLSHPLLIKKFTAHKKHVERIVGLVLIGFGLKVATTNLAL